MFRDSKRRFHEIVGDVIMMFRTYEQNVFHRNTEPVS
jgi:hypothetical protein